MSTKAARAKNIIKLPVSRAKRGKRSAQQTFESAHTARWLLEGLTDPTVPLPGPVSAAIEARAEVMAREAVALFREHLCRAVAYNCEQGAPRYLNVEEALQLVAAKTLDDALARRHMEKLRNVRESLGIMNRLAQKFAEEMDNELPEPPRVA